MIPTETIGERGTQKKGRSKGRYNDHRKIGYYNEEKRTQNNRCIRCFHHGRRFRAFELFSYVRVCSAELRKWWLIEADGSVNINRDAIGGSLSFAFVFLFLFVLFRCEKKRILFQFDEVISGLSTPYSVAAQKKKNCFDWRRRNASHFTLFTYHNVIGSTNKKNVEGDS